MSMSPGGSEGGPSASDSEDSPSKRTRFSRQNQIEDDDDNTDFLQGMGAK